MRKRMKKMLYIGLGFLFMFLGILGVFLPLLPTTPFIILAAFFFSQSSQRSHQWLLENKLFGPILSNWENSRCIPYFAKMLSFSMIAVFGTISVFTLSFIWLKVLTLALISYGCYFIYNIKTCCKEKSAIKL